MRCVGGELIKHLKILSFPDSKRYIIPIYDTILLPGTDESLIAILPLQRPLDSPPFSNLYEALECILQLVEVKLLYATFLPVTERLRRGLLTFTPIVVCTGENCVPELLVWLIDADRDVSKYHILMQGSTGMFPKGWHFSSPLDYHPGDTITSKAPLKSAPFLPRTLVPPRYFFIDFELSVIFEPGESHFRIGSVGSIFAPEMGDLVLVDSYAVDVWAMGVSIRDLMNGPGVCCFRSI
jgi:hypothetical protein